MAPPLWGFKVCTLTQLFFKSEWNQSIHLHHKNIQCSLRVVIKHLKQWYRFTDVTSKPYQICPNLDLISKYDISVILSLPSTQNTFPVLANTHLNSYSKIDFHMYQETQNWNLHNKMEASRWPISRPHPPCRPRPLLIKLLQIDKSFYWLKFVL